MADVILHRSAASSASFSDGELRVGSRSLKLTTLTGTLDLPLDVQPLPAAAGEASEVCVQASDGAVWRSFTQGGGARPYDAQPWRVPGVTPLRFESVHVASSTLQAVVEVTQPLTIDRLAVKATGSGSVSFGVRDAVTLTLLASATGEIGADDVLIPLDMPNGEPLVLQPGRYLTYCTADDADVEVLVGQSTWCAGETRFPVFFSPVLS